MSYLSSHKLNNYDFFKDTLRNTIVKGATLFNLTPEQIQHALGEMEENVIEIVGDVPLE